MNPNAQFERDLEEWLQAEAPASAPAGFHATVMARARTLRQRPGWTTTLPARRLGRGRGITLLAAASLLLVGGALAAGSGFLRQPSVVPPVPAPSSAAVAIASPDATSTHTPTPSVSESPSPTPVSLKLAWTQVALDEKSPRVAWVGDRFVLADMESGAVRTSTDGVNWQPLQPGDAAPGFVHLLGGSIASWQDTFVGLWHPQDGPDISGAPPTTARDVVTIVHPPAAPISTTPFRGRVESIGIGPKGIVAEVHSVLDPNANPGNDFGFGWYSPNGEHWTQMARRGDLSDLPGAKLPTGAFGDVVGVSDGFLASGGCAHADDFCSGLWFSSDGLTWRFLGKPGAGLIPWMGGALVTDGDGRLDFWTSGGLSKLPIAGDLLAITEGHNGYAPLVGTGPPGLVGLSVFAQKAVVSPDGSDLGISPLPAQMGGSSSRNWWTGIPTLAVGDRSVLVLARDGEWPRSTWSLWLGTLEP